MADINSRGLDEPVLVALKEQAARESVSVNALVVRLLEQASGVRSQSAALRRYHDLDALFGTWTEEEAAEFDANTAIFNEIAPDVWKAGNDAR